MNKIHIAKPPKPDINKMMDGLTKAAKNITPEIALTTVSNLTKQIEELKEENRKLKSDNDFMSGQIDIFERFQSNKASKLFK